jgi:hypothetical protein
MLLLLTDENIAPAVAEQAQSKSPDIVIQSLHRWQSGAFLGKADSLRIEAAHREGWTLLTYDQKTIPPLLMELAAVGADHSGVVFVDEDTIVSRDIGGLVKAILVMFDRCAEWDWENRISFLDAAPQ